MVLITINDIVYDSYNKEDTNTIGKYFEEVFHDKLQEHNITDYIHLSLDKRYALIDFIKKDASVLLELKTRLCLFEDLTIAYIELSKIKYFEKFKRTHPDTKLYIVYGHLLPDNIEKINYFYYEIDLNTIYDILFYNNYKNKYELPTRILKPFNFDILI